MFSMEKPTQILKLSQLIQQPIFNEKLLQRSFKQLGILYNIINTNINIFVCILEKVTE